MGIDVIDITVSIDTAPFLYNSAVSLLLVSFFHHAYHYLPVTFYTSSPAYNLFLPFSRTFCLVAKVGQSPLAYSLRRGRNCRHVEQILRARYGMCRSRMKGNVYIDFECKLQ
jgi:hypothetical protein